MTETRRGPLTGVKVVDLTRVVMGPFATQILADQGADVIMVEERAGDGVRLMGPGPHPEFSGLALNLLRNKRSVQLDLKSEADRAVVLELIAQADVVVATMRPSALRRLGVDYESVARGRSDLIYCQAQGHPLGSGREEDPAYDDIIQASIGVPDIVNRVWGEPGLLPTIFVDKVCGIVIAQAVSAALFSRSQTGQGQHIEVAMQEAMTAFMLAEHGSGAISEPPTPQEGREATGYPRLLTPERRPHPTRDGWIHMLAYQAKHYRILFTAAGVEGAEDDPRYADTRAAILNSDSLYRQVREIAPQRTTQEWLDFCREHGIPATEVRSLQDLVDGLPLAAHPVTGQYRVIPRLARFSGDAENPVPRPAPRIGEHTDTVLRSLENSSATVDRGERP